MTNREKHQELWQRKRSEQHINTDVQADWSEMNNLLDAHMPVGSPGAAGTGGQASNLAKGLSQLAKYKLFYAVGGLIVAGAITYTVIRNNPAVKENKQDKTEIRKDSLFNANVAEADSMATDVTVPTDAEKAIADSHKPAIDDKATSATNAAEANNVKTDQASGNGASSLSNKAAGSAITKNGNIPSALNSFSANNYKDQRNNASGSGTDNTSNAITTDNVRVAATSLQIVTPNLYTSSNTDVAMVSGSYQPSMSRQTSRIRMISRLARVSGPGWLARLFSSGIFAKRYKTFDEDRNGVTEKDLARADKQVDKENAKNKKEAKRDEKIAQEKDHSSNKENLAGSNLDWGLLVGLNTNGSFTAKSQNKNIYGSLSPDIYLGAFANYNISDSWALGFQARALVPHNISKTYNYTHHLTADTSSTTQTLAINDSRKIYTVDVPIYAIYKVSSNFNLKAGALLSMPVKQVNGPNSFDIYGPLRDSAGYYESVTNDINASQYDKKLRIGASFGLGYTYKFFWIDATYNFQGQRINSALGSYNANSNNLQLTIGFKFNKSK